jgi:4-hydroxy 2-oxovalerate aldolase
MESIKILDCTLRDGGYYNNWDFDLDLVQEYLNAMSESRIDLVEIGLRSFIGGKYYGPFFYSTDDFLRELNIPEGLNVGVMINAKEYIKDDQPNFDLLNKAFTKKIDSPLHFIRIAAHIHEIENTAALISCLKEKGYVVGLNVMQISNADNAKQEEMFESISRIKELDVLYFADSVGNLVDQDIIDIVGRVKKYWKKPIGIHTHNNRGRAVQNSIQAIRQGVTWIDSTISGMGRGAGNSQTEYLLLELKELKIKEYKTESLFDLVLGPFQELKEKYKWGQSLSYFISATHNIHPTYIQEMNSDPHQKPEKLIRTIQALKEIEATSFSVDKLISASKTGVQNCEGDWSPKSFIKSKNILILGPGPSSSKHKTGIENFIKKNKPFVIALNSSLNYDESLISLYAASHPFRLYSEVTGYKKLNKPLVTPLALWPESLREKVSGTTIFNYGLNINQDDFISNEFSCVLPNRLVVSYALAMAIQASPEKIFLAGFDGYEKGNQKQEEMEISLGVIEKLFPSNIELISITPTTYNLRQESLYSPKVH